LIANSKYTQERIKKYYRRDSEVIYPPAYISKHEARSMKYEENTRYEIPDTKYFLIVSRLSPYKKVDLAVEAFNKLELPLVVIGQGEQEKHLRKIAGKNVRIVGWQNEKDLEKYYLGARAFIFPSEDDFGITVVEAMSYGKPVIAYQKGGANETVIEGRTGEFFGAQTAEVLADAVRRFMEKEEQYNKEVIISRAKEFSKERFKEELSHFISEKCKFQNACPKCFAYRSRLAK
jgi:glycosyltransferase involved in cell wall biosynthesis